MYEPSISTIHHQEESSKYEAFSKNKKKCLTYQSFADLILFFVSYGQLKLEVTNLQRNGRSLASTTEQEQLFTSSGTANIRSDVDLFLYAESDLCQLGGHVGIQMPSQLEKQFTQYHLHQMSLFQQYTPDQFRNNLSDCNQRIKVDVNFINVSSIRHQYEIY